MSADASSRGPGPLARLLVGCAFLAAGLAAIVIFLRVFAPQPWTPPKAVLRDYDREAVFRRLTPGALVPEVDRILALGSRSLGQEGFYACERMILERYRAAGLEVRVQEHDSVQPVTVRAEVRDAGGAVLPTRLYPLFPNHIQPMVTPEEGVAGTLVRLDDRLVFEGRGFEGMIGLIDASAPRALDKNGFAWARYARLGFKALLVAHPEGLDRIENPQLQRLNESGWANCSPVSYVRAVADPSVFGLLGKEVRLCVRQELRSLPVRNIVGLLRAPGEADEALVLPVAYDGLSPLPDLNPGGVQASHLAVHFALLDGLAAQRDRLRRGVVFVAVGSRMMAQDGMNQVLRAVGVNGKRGEARQALEELRGRHDAAMTALAPLPALFADPAFMSDPEATRRTLDALPPASREFFEGQFTYVLNRFVFDLSRGLTDAQAGFLRDRTRDLKGAPYLAFMKAKRAYDAAFSVAGYTVDKFLREGADLPCRASLAGRLDQLAAHHRTARARAEQDLAVHDLVRPFGRLVVLAPEFMPAKEDPPREKMSFTMSHDLQHKFVAPGLFELLDATAQELRLKDRLAVDFSGRGHGGTIRTKTLGMPVAAELWTRAGYPAMSLVNNDRSYSDYARAAVPEGVRAMRGLDASLKVAAETALTLAAGNGRPDQHPLVAPWRFRGGVFVSGIGQSILPSFPMDGALLYTKTGAPYATYGQLLFRADPYGRYDYETCLAPFGKPYEYSPEACAFGADGRIRYIKDEGARAQAVYKSLKLSPAAAARPVNIVLFEATAVSVLDLENPQSLSLFSGLELVETRGLVPLANQNSFLGDGVATAFVPPAKEFYALLKAGSADNEKVQATRAFLHNATAAEVEAARAGRDAGDRISGPGYLAADTPVILDVPRRVTESMLVLNGRRFALQDAYRMVDEQTRTFQERSLASLAASGNALLPAHEADRLARDAETYAILNHPQLRASIREAVVGILWYLGLLVPFVFFFEKLVFGFADIRRQLAAQAVIFLAAFGLLKLLHPAFEMVRSSLMILLGFVIMLISLGITVLFSGKFQENLEEIRRKRGKVSAAGTNALGVLGTAFMLGLNNMHRRKVRTGLTCATLVLLTFVMICFTSMSNNLVNSATAVGKAHFQGLLVKTENHVSVGGSVSALNVAYGDRYDVLPRLSMVGTEDWLTRERSNPKVSLLRDLGAGGRLAAEAESILVFRAKDPVQRQVRLLTKRGWFPAVPPPGKVSVAMLPDALAEKLGVTPAMVDGGDVDLDICGRKYRVWGIFDSRHFDALRDLDGRGYLPFDLLALRNASKQNGGFVAEDTDPVIGSARVILALHDDAGHEAPAAETRVSSIAVCMPDDLSYKAAGEEITRYLEKSGRPTSYGLGGIAFQGRIARERTLAGLVDLLIPLLIAALTVLNTMKGSVYERKDEIYIYNAVGIAPGQVFFMFFAEALVYAVVGSVLGFILSQGTGRVLTELDLTGGLNMTFTTVNSIYASLAIMAAVFVSTLFPARTAMAIAAPAEDAGWSLPEPEGDRLRFNLPFTFDARDRVAVLAFFHRYLADHGEGSAGPFFVGPPALGVSGAGDAPVPEIRATVWLKPFDLGVSQDFRIELPTDPETGEFIARLTLGRLSGTREAWLRLNRGFVTVVRRHFLHWRAVAPEQKAEMHAEAKDLLERDVAVSGSRHA